MKSFIRMLMAAVGLSSMSIAIADTVPVIDFATAVSDTENWREVDPENMIMFEITDYLGKDKGTVLIETAEFAAPGHVQRFKDVARSGDFDGTVFHRVIDGFMSQGGDIDTIKPKLAGKWGNIPGEFVFERFPNDPADKTPPVQLLGPKNTATDGYILGFPVQTQSEFLASMTKTGAIESWIPHCKGVVSTARTDDPNSASTQFFLMRDTSPHLDRTYTAWGRILDGQGVVDDMKKGEPVIRPDVLKHAVVVADMPAAERPRVLVQRTDGPLFQGFLTQNTDTKVCSHPPVPTLVSR